MTDVGLVCSKVLAMTSPDGSKSMISAAQNGVQGKSRRRSPSASIVI